MAYISEEDINKIRKEANIVDIIGSYIDLTKSGNDYVGICPFHEDHTPSMRVSTKLNIYKCFVCNAGGNVFSFVQNFENVSFPEAVKIVALKSGINFNYDVTKKVSKFDQEYKLMDLSLKYYQNNLATSNGIEAKKYLNERGINDNIIKEFKLGLSLDNNSLLKFLEDKKIDLEMANNVGLLNKSDIRYYDMFQNRIMIPILDNSGNLVAYTARIYNMDSDNKYINSKETLIYKKSNVLFNYYNAKDTARIKKEIIIVEGNMDAIMLSVYGIKNVIALMGVNLSNEQIKDLKKLNSKIIIMLDNDDAGKSATLNIGDILVKNNLNPYVVRLDTVKDPDEYIRKYGTDKLLDKIKNSIRYLDYKISILKENYNLERPMELSNYIKEIIPLLNNLDEIERDVIISKICKDYNIDENVIKKNLTKKEIKEIKKNVEIKKIHKSKYTLACESLIYAMLLNKDYYQIYFDKLGYLINKVERDTVSLIGSYVKKYKTIEISGFLDYINTREEIYNYVSNIINLSDEEDISKEEFNKLLDIVSKEIDKEEIKKIKEKIKEEQDEDKKMELIERLTELKKGSGYDERN